MEQRYRSSVIANMKYFSPQSAKRFRSILIRERFRADRNNSKFSVILLNVESMTNDNGKLHGFIESLITTIRISDDIGWHDENRIGIILPETTQKGAEKLAEKILASDSYHSGNIECQIYTYPSRKFLLSENESVLVPHDDLQDKMAVGYNMPLWKRMMDIIGAGLGLIVLSPLFALVAILIKAVSPEGPVFFMQDRVGHGGKLFKMFKFRTMMNGNDASVHRDYLKQIINGDKSDGTPMVKLKDDKRIIPFGNIIRKSSIDELPQLINVFLGDMSLIGPRPCIPYEADEYLCWHARRFDIVPGMTGLWQVSGKNNISFKEMIRLDIKYAHQRTFLLDLIILFKTPIVVFSQMFEDKVKSKPKVIAKTSTVDNRKMLIETS